MRVRSCPYCSQRMLFQTGAFWACANCGYAITQSALLVDEARAKRGGKAIGADSVPREG